MTDRHAPDRNKVHELQGLAGGLDFLAKRLARDVEESPASMVAFSEAVARYAGIVDTYSGLLVQNVTLLAEQTVLFTDLKEIAALLCANDSGRPTPKPRVISLISRSITRLKILADFYS